MTDTPPHLDFCQMQQTTYRVRLFFEWGGGCIWSGSKSTTQQFGVGPIEDKLPLSPSMRDRLKEMSDWHDGALNWDDPPAPGPWTPVEHQRFEAAAKNVLSRVQGELGSAFEVVYEP